MSDRLIVTCLGCIFSACLETVLAMKLYNGGRQEAQIKLDRYCSFLFPLCFLLVLKLYVLG